jgi:ATP-binding cassette subfamily B protein RaxB
MNHFVVLKKVARRSVIVLDPSVGERRLSIAQFSRHFTGIALELAPNSDFKAKENAPRLKLSQLTGRIRGLRSSLTCIFVVAVTVEILSLVAPMFNQIIIDDVLTSGDHDLLNVLAVGFGLLLLARTAMSLARSWMVMVLGQTLSLQWKGNVFAHLLRLPVDFFARRHLGDVVSRFGAVDDIQKTLTNATLEAALDGMMVIAAFAMMVIYAPLLAGSTGACVLGYGLLRWAVYRPCRDAAAERLLMSAKEQTHFLETLRAIQPLKLFCREEERRARWQNLMMDVQNRDVRTARLTIGFSTVNIFLFGIENLLVLWLGARMVLMSQTGPTAAPFTVGMLFAYLSYKEQFTRRMSALIDFAVELRMLGVHAERLADIALAAPQKDEVPDSDLQHLSPSLELRNVSFRYAEGEAWLLHHANVIIAAGENVAITGTSGAGKTTVLKILLGLLAPTGGEVLYGGVPLSQLGLNNVRMQLGTVMQDDLLLAGTLAENISFFDVQPDYAYIERCATLAQLHADIVKMPMGYQTMVGDLGTGLSGGQKQRLLLARALYKKPKVLLLDEATSHLDVFNERAVNAALSAMDLTRLIIAHRPDTIAAADRVLQLKDGALVEVKKVTRFDAGDQLAFAP